MVDYILNLLWGHGLGTFRRFNDIRAKGLNVTGKNILWDRQPQVGCHEGVGVTARCFLGYPSRCYRN